MKSDQDISEIHPGKPVAHKPVSHMSLKNSSLKHVLSLSTKVFIAFWVCLTVSGAGLKNPAWGVHEHGSFTHQELSALVNQANAIFHDRKPVPEPMRVALQYLKEQSHLPNMSDKALIYLLDQLKHRETTNLGHHLHMMLHYTKALLTRLRSFSSHQAMIKQLFTQAADSIEEGNYPLAGKFLVQAEKATKTTDQKENPALLAEILANQGDLKYSQLDYLAAADRFSHAASILSGTKKSQSAADLAQRAGEIYAEIGLDQKAEIYFKKVLAIRENQKPINGMKTANILNNLAFIYEQADRLDKAREMYQQALQILAKTGKEKSRAAQITRDYLDNLGQHVASSSDQKSPRQKSTEHAPTATTSRPHIH